MAAAGPQVALAIRNVLVATDFSSCSERALLHAVAAAHHFGSTLHLLHVVQPGLFSFVPPEAYVGTSEAVVRAMDLAGAETRALLNRVLRHTHCQDLNHRTWVQAGEVGEVLRAIIEREHIDLAVVGTHGRTGFRKLVLGSVAEDVFRYASCPVLTVGPHSWQSDPQTVRLKHVLFPTDFSPDSARALPLATAITADFAAKLTMLHVVERLDGEAAHDRQRIVNALQQRMREMVADAGAMPPGVDFQVAFGDVADRIIETAARLGVDLVAFGLKAPDTPVDRLPWMHAYKVVCEVECPVLSLRGPTARWQTD
ncbi:MAG TPA: universal stress protein [Terriglobales bacterium]